MHKIGIPDTIKRIEGIFRSLGFWRKKDGFDGLHFVHIILFIYFGTHFIYGLFQYFLILQALLGTVQVCRMYCIIWKKRQILDLIQKVGHNNCTDDSEVFDVADKKLKNLMNRVKNFCVILALSFVIAIILPVAIYFDLNENHIMLDRREFWFTYVDRSVGYFLFLICCLLTAIVWYMMLIFVIKFEFLENKLKMLGRVKGAGMYSKEIYLSSKGREELFMTDLLDSMKNYNEINESIAQFESTFSSLFFAQAITSGLCICGSFSNLLYIYHDSVLDAAFSWIIFNYCFYDCWMVMYLGNEITLSSDRLPNALFESDWMSQTETCKKYVSIFTERLKQPRKLVAGKLFPLNMLSFKLILLFVYIMMAIIPYWIWCIERGYDCMDDV